MKKLSQLIDRVLDGGDHSVAPAIFVCAMLFLIVMVLYGGLMLAMGYR